MERVFNTYYIILHTVNNCEFFVNPETDADTQGMENS